MHSDYALFVPSGASVLSVPYTRDFPFILLCRTLCVLPASFQHSVIYRPFLLVSILHSLLTCDPCSRES